MKRHHRLALVTLPLTLGLSIPYNIVLNDFDAKKSTRYSQMLVVNELIVNGTLAIDLCSLRNIAK